MTSINYLTEVIAAEAELTEQLVEVMRQQQSALVKTDASMVERTTERQQELLLPIEGLEQERVRLTREVWSEITKRDHDAGAVMSLASLISVLPTDMGATVAAAGSRLHSAVEQMMKLNQANQYLIEHSRQFVRGTLKIVTNGFARQLVDQKI